MSATAQAPETAPPNRRPAGEIPPSLILVTNEILAVGRFSRTTLWRRLREGTFPAPIPDGGDHRRWRRADIEAWVKGEWTPAKKAA